MNIKETDRGFQVGAFRDANDQECSIQQSSAIGDYHDAYDRPGTSFLWLGLDRGRMHLTREQARELALLLTRWCDTGRLAK